jgi:apolipoprotein N-acyltransferase
MNLSDFRDMKEVASKLIRYSEPNKNKKTIFVWPEGVFSSEDFSQLKDIKYLFKKNFSKNHLIIFGVNTTKRDLAGQKYFNSMLVVDKNLNVFLNMIKKNWYHLVNFCHLKIFLI